jgi:hypothetical protein
MSGSILTLSFVSTISHHVTFACEEFSCSPCYERQSLRLMLLLQIICCYSLPALLSCAAPYYPGGNMFSRNPPMPKEVSSCGAAAQHWPAGVTPRMHAGACMALQSQQKRSAGWCYPHMQQQSVEQPGPQPPQCCQHRCHVCPPSSHLLPRPSAHA